MIKSKPNGEAAALALERTVTPPSPPSLASRLALRPVEAALALGISTRKLWEITADQSCGIPNFKIGTSVFYPVDPLRVWVAEQARRGRRG